MASAAAGGKVSVPGPVTTSATEWLAVRPLGVDRVRPDGGVFADWQEANRKSTVDLNRVELQIDRAMVGYHLWASRGPSVMRVFRPIWSVG